MTEYEYLSKKFDFFPRLGHVASKVLSVSVANITNVLEFVKPISFFFNMNDVSKNVFLLFFRDLTLKRLIL